MSDEVEYQLGLGPEYIYFQFPILRITWFAESVSHLLLISMMDKFVFILDTIPFVWTLGFHMGRLIVFKQLSSENTYFLARYIYKTIFNKHCLLPLHKNTHTYSSSKQPNKSSTFQVLLSTWPHSCTWCLFNTLQDKQEFIMVLVCCFGKDDLASSQNSSDPHTQKSLGDWFLFFGVREPFLHHSGILCGDL